MNSWHWGWSQLGFVMYSVVLLSTTTTTTTTTISIYSNIINPPFGNEITISMWSSRPHEGLTICRSHSNCSTFIPSSLKSLSAGPAGVWACKLQYDALPTELTLLYVTNSYCSVLIYWMTVVLLIWRVISVAQNVQKAHMDITVLWRALTVWMVQSVTMSMEVVLVLLVIKDIGKSYKVITCIFKY